MRRPFPLAALALTACSAPDSSPDVRLDASSDVAPAPADSSAPEAAAPSDASADAARASMSLATRGTTITRADGTPIDFRGAISCCGGGYGWPLFDEAWVDYVATKGVSFLHVRLGPFLTGPDGESDWASTGGGYVETSGKADLSKFNPAFWARVRALVQYAASRGMWVEIDVADGWAVKHCRAGDQPGYSAWDKAWNVQTSDACAAAGTRAIEAGSVQDAWVRKVFDETASFDNVLYQDGNELGLVPGYASAWSTSMQAILRDVESNRGLPRHLFGTNSGDATTSQQVDYVEQHETTAPKPAACGGKPCLSNEYNPDPALSPEALHEQFCLARAMGTYFWYWRHGQTQQEMDQTLTLLQRGCP